MDVFGRMNAVPYQYSTTSIMQKSSTSSSLMPCESVSDRINLRSSTVPVPDAYAALDDDVASPTSFGGVVSAVSGIDLLLCTLLNLST